MAPSLVRVALLLLVRLSSTYGNEAVARTFAEMRRAHLENESNRNARREFIEHCAPAKFDMFLEDGDENFQALLRHETQGLFSSPEISAAHIACGPLSRAMAARRAMQDVADGNEYKTPQVTYSNDRHDVACWQLSLNATGADLLSRSKALFHVSMLPTPTKLQPTLLALTPAGEMMINPMALQKGVQVVLEPRTRPQTETERAHQLSVSQQLAKRWAMAKWGLGHRSHLSRFFPLYESSSTRVHRAWQPVADALGECKDSVLVDRDHQPGRLRLFFASVTSEKCAILAVAFLAIQPEVGRLEIIETAKVALVDKTKVPRGRDVRPLFQPGTAVVPMNERATGTVQSGGSGTPLWDIGVNGTGQFAQVVDTGFDDASCFLRDLNSESLLTGSLSSTKQVARSLYSDAYTDKSFRKIVQYISRYDSQDYWQNYASGHGTHCAGTVAGYAARDKDYNDDYTCSYAADFYSNCADYVSYCGTWFGSGGAYEGINHRSLTFASSRAADSSSASCVAGTCDTTCGISSCLDGSPDGLAPGAQLMVLDVGDSDGNLDVPSDYYDQIFMPAYKHGARISSNSWGSSQGYYYSTVYSMDEMIYDNPDFLVVVAASNDGDECEFHRPDCLII
jgi:subtilisin family serine protease